MSERAEEEIAIFVEAMRHEIKANAHKGTWKDHGVRDLLIDLIYHVAKLKKAVDIDDEHAILELSADVGNCAMFVADVTGALLSDNIVEDIAYLGTQDLMEASGQFYDSLVDTGFESVSP